MKTRKLKATIRKDLMKQGLSVPVADYYYSGRKPLPCRWIGDDRFEVYHSNQWRLAYSIDWDFN